MKLLLERSSSRLHETPYTAEVILETGAKINIDRANVDAVRADLIIDVPDDKVERVAELFRQKGVKVKKLLKLIAWDEERCVHCGACISVCPTGVFKFDSSWNICMEEEKCVRCEVCVKACPLGALALACVENEVT
ncbi:MAG: 4Fe-4S binding protein [Halobacteriota archaeon]